MSEISRPVLPNDAIADEAAQEMAAFHHSTVSDVQRCVAEHAIVVVGMRQNPVVKEARKALETAGLAYHYLEYGNYLVGWKQRLAIKLWSGWATFPQVFVAGKLIGGSAQTVAAIERGERDGRGPGSIHSAQAKGS